MPIDSPWLIFVAGISLGCAITLLGSSAYLRSRARGAARAAPALRDRPAGSFFERAEQSRADLQARVQLLGNSIRESLLYIDAGLRCQEHNEAFEQALGLSAAEIDGRPLRELLDETSYECIQESIGRVLQGERVRIRQLHRNPEGHILLFDARYVPHFDRSGRVLGFYALLTPAMDKPFLEPRLQPLSSAAVSRAERSLHSGIAVCGSGAQEPAVADVAQDERRDRFLHALHGGQFRLFEQSIVPVDRDGMEPTYHEVLVRLRNDKARLVHPAAFVDAASGTACMRALDRWVVERLLRWYANNKQSFESGSSIGFHVNLSRDSVCDQSFPVFLRAAIACQAVEPESLCFEISEADLIGQRTESIACAYALRMLGCRVAIDRFGGTSDSLSSLLGMPTDFVKIDGSIIGRILIDPFSRTKARAIARVTQSMGARTIAERVEDADSLELLRELGISYVQGFGIAMPEPIERLASPLPGRARDRLSA